MKYIFFSFAVCLTSSFILLRVIVKQCLTYRALRYPFIAAIQCASECTMPLQDRRFRSGTFGDADRWRWRRDWKWSYLNRLCRHSVVSRARNSHCFKEVNVYLAHAFPFAFSARHHVYFSLTFLWSFALDTFRIKPSWKTSTNVILK